MRLYFDLNLGYLVSTPGQADPLSGLAFKAGDEASVEVQFGRSNIFSKPDVPAWRSELLATSSNITIGLKLDTDFTDGDLLAGESDYTSGSSNCYVFALNLNTVEINTALGRDGGGTELASVECNFEVTYQDGGAGGWNSSTLPVPAVLYHDVLLGNETAPSNASDHNYPTKSDVIVWYPSRVGLTGGGATKLDGIATTTLTAGYAAALLDESATPDTLRTYRLEAGTDAESAPDVIRPDDYGVSNQKIWRLYGGSSGTVTLDTNTVTSGLTGILKAASNTLDVAVAGTDYAAALGADDNYVTDAEKTKLANLSGTNTGDQDLSGLMVKSANLSDVANAATARTNLGLATVAATGAYADLSGAPTAFDPASPGAIGGTTPSTGAFTTLALTPPANTSGLTISGFSLTGSNAQSMIGLAGTWNTSGTATGFKLNVTDTASNAASMLFDFQVSGTSKFACKKDGSVLLSGSGGLITVSGNSNVFTVQRAGLNAMQVDNSNCILAGGSLYLGGSTDLNLARASAATLQLGVNHATTATLQTIKAHNVTTGTGADLCLKGGTGSVASGKVRFGTHSAVGAETITGYITIKDEGGTERKVAVIS